MAAQRDEDDLTLIPSAQFETDFRDWLEGALAEGVPSGVVAFAFNLHEHFASDTRYAVELVGAGAFDEDDSDWACDEIWEPAAGRDFSITRSFSGETWESCLDRITMVVTSILKEETQLSKTLRTVRGIGIGFVDGELMLLWRA